MQLNGSEFVAIAGLLKRAQETKKKDAPKAKKKRPTFSAAYPAYSKSMLSQIPNEPRKAGLRRAAGTGSIGAILGAVAARLLSDNPRLVGGAALAGGLATGIPGYMSGKNEAESEHSKLLFLKRLGITRPGELETLLRNPEVADKVMGKGVVV